MKKTGHIPLSKVNHIRKTVLSLPVFICSAGAVVLFLLTVAMCGAAEFKNLSITYKDDILKLEAAFDNPITYNLRTGNNGRTITLLVPKADYLKTIVEQTEIPQNDILYGWTLREVNGSLVVEFFLTGPYSYSHNGNKPNTIQIEIYGIKKNVISTASSQPSDGLARGITLFESGRYDDALNEFREVLSNNERTPVLYYYAAHVRLKKKQYKRAQDNLVAALRDSAGYSDARGLLAYTLLQLGDKSGALAEWKTFVSTVGTPDDETTITAASIMLPEDYRKQFANKQKERLAAEKSEKARIDSVAAVQQALEQEILSTKSPPDSTSLLGNEADSYGIETDGDLESRNRRNIKTGIYGLILCAFLVISFVVGFTIWIRKRLQSKEELLFDSEMKRIIEERAEDTEFYQNSEEFAVRKYQSLNKDISNVTTVAEDPVDPIVSDKEEHIVSSELAPEKEQPTRAESTPQVGSRSDTITEEVKALVTRMYKEGASTAEIARTSDLTQTEVDLIIAVRARRVDQLIKEAVIEEEEYIHTDQLFKAIVELNSEGISNREIARKLSISTSEVHLSLSLVNFRKEHQ
ncbi:tetratricopeptide repeat protein [Candidatus Omnitrophota bacterium]